MMQRVKVDVEEIVGTKGRDWPLPVAACTLNAKITKTEKSRKYVYKSGCVVV